MSREPRAAQQSVSPASVPDGVDVAVGVAAAVKVHDHDDDHVNHHDLTRERTPPRPTRRSCLATTVAVALAIAGLAAPSRRAFSQPAASQPAASQPAATQPAQPSGAQQPASQPAQQSAVAGTVPLVALVPPVVGEGAYGSVAIGPAGEVYAPDGMGAWTRRDRYSTADAISTAARAGTSIVALGDGIVYRFAPNGWTALRFPTKSRAKMSSGARAIAAIGRQLFALDKLVAGVPTKVATVSSGPLAIGAGTAIVVRTDAGLVRVAGTASTPIKLPAAVASKPILQLVGDRWAIVPGSIVDLRTSAVTAWPPGISVYAGALGPNDRFVGAALAQSGLELVTIHNRKLTREAVAVDDATTPVGVMLDRDGRAVIAMRDGRIAVRARGATGTWSVTTVRDEPPPPRAGPPPARVGSAPAQPTPAQPAPAQPAPAQPAPAQPTTRPAAP